MTRTQVWGFILLDIPAFGTALRVVPKTSFGNHVGMSKKEGPSNGGRPFGFASNQPKKSVLWHHPADFVFLSHLNQNKKQMHKSDSPQAPTQSCIRGRILKLFDRTILLHHLSRQKYSKTQVTPNLNIVRQPPEDGSNRCPARLASTSPSERVKNHKKVLAPHPNIIYRGALLLS